MKTLLLSLAAIFVSACATPTPSVTDQDTALLQGSRIEVDYVLGHVRRRLVLQARNGSVSGQNFYERQMLREVQISTPHYESYWKKVSEYAERHPGKTADSGAVCKNTYRITLETAAGTRKVEGCRTHAAEDSSLSHLIREGEFILTRRVSAEGS